MQRLIFCFIALIITIVCIVYTAPPVRNEHAGHPVRIIKKSGYKPQVKILRPKIGAARAEDPYQGLIIIERSNSAYHKKLSYE
jgi:hypothetical protein